MEARWGESPMTKPSGKPRKHRSGTGSRASRAVVVDALREENRQLRQLVTHKKFKSELWHAIGPIIELVAFLDDENTPAKSNRWDSPPGHAADTAILPGIQTPHRDGDFKLRHAGTQAADLEKWVLKMLEWIPKQVEFRLTGEQPVARPSLPRRTFDAFPVKDSEGQVNAG